jgi:hypothetical protein
MSTLRLTTISNLGGTASVPSETVINGSAKAWVNFNGTGTVAIRASFNVTSITDNGVGDYTVNFTNAMTDSNFAISGIAGETGGTEVIEVLSRTTSSVRIADYTSETGGNKDSTLVCIIVFR